MRTTAYSFSRLLNPDEANQLSRTAEWRWISTLWAKGAEPVQEAKHLRWMKVGGNTHAPPFREVMLTFRGRAVHSLEGSVYERSPGTVMLFDHYESRDLKGATHKKNFHTLWLHFHSRQGLTCNSNSCDERGRYFQEIPTQVMSGARVAAVMEAWDQCRREPGDLLCRELLKAQVTALLLEVLGRSQPDPAGEGEPHGQVVEAVRQYIRAHLVEPLPLRALAQIAGYSPFFFHRLFVKHTGETPVEYVNGARLERAKELMLAGYTAQAAAESVGFASVSYFSNLFRRQFGCPPRRWATKAGEGSDPESLGPSAGE